MSKWKPEEAALLGTATDIEIAKRLGRTAYSVRRNRIYRGIPCIPSANLWSPEEIALLGTAPDAEIAKRIGRSVSSVIGARYHRGIPNFEPD